VERYEDIEEYRGYVLMVDRLREDHPWFEVWFSDGTTVIPEISRFCFNWTQARFNWLIDHAFPSAPVVHSPLGDIHVPWSNRTIDLARGASDAETS